MSSSELVGVVRAGVAQLQESLLAALLASTADFVMAPGVHGPRAPLEATRRRLDLLLAALDAGASA